MPQCGLPLLLRPLISPRVIRRRPGAGRQSVNGGLSASWSVTSPPGWVIGGAAYRSGDEKSEFRIRCKFESRLESVLKRCRSERPI
jgi:hypothetical protein